MCVVPSSYLDFVYSSPPLESRYTCCMLRAARFLRRLTSIGTAREAASSGKGEVRRRGADALQYVIAPTDIIGGRLSIRRGTLAKRWANVECVRRNMMCGEDTIVRRLPALGKSCAADDDALAELARGSWAVLQRSGVCGWNLFDHPIFHRPGQHNSPATGAPSLSRRVPADDDPAQFPELAVARMRCPFSARRAMSLFLSTAEHSYLRNRSTWPTPTALFTRSPNRGYPRRQAMRGTFAQLSLADPLPPLHASSLAFLSLWNGHHCGGALPFSAGVLSINRNVEGRGEHK
ncbi:hypothetical protein K438DRAFT_1972261 [Mycena galopus ATCC 62051]|nr:hypothetical protein K438DRAFT_1972261 [Mycena galopus ATCC 62051]